MSASRCAVLMDLDGTLYERGALIPGALAAIERTRAAGHPVRFLTNTDSVPATTVLSRLAGLGLSISEDELFTPVAAARALLGETAGACALLLVSAAVQPSFAGFTTGDTPTHVVVGDCRDVLDYPRLDAAFRALRAGAQLIALQRGRYFRAADGDHLDTGAVVAALEYAAGTSALTVGKPDPRFFELAARSAGAVPADCVVVGDDATTDVAGGAAAGARTVQVRTGKYADQRRESGLPAADVVIGSIAGLPAVLTACPGGPG